MNENTVSIRELIDRIERLERINNALMDRVERSVDTAGDAYALFESNIVMQRLVTERTRQLEQTNSALSREIETRRLAEQSLVRAKEQAESASRAKSEFLANMSHEIRTPMTAVLGYADLAIDELHDPSRLADHLGVIRRNAQHLLTVINDILDLSKLDAGEMRPVVTRVCPAETCAGVAEMLRVQADAKGLSLSVLTAPGTPDAVITDAVRLRQILLNLVGNAIKFTEHGSVQIELSHADHTSMVRVRDTGIGIDPEQLENIFLPFHQADTSAARRHGGTGLGLSIARRLAQLLGGDLTAQSLPGTGSVFTLTIHAPAAPAALPPPQTTTTTTAASVQRPLTGRRILLAEDGPDNQKLISFILSRAGAEVVIAEDGLAALELTARTRPPFDLILMDMQMPRMDGYAAARALRERGDRTPVLALTAHAMSGDRQKCLAAGCDDYLTKPVDRDALIQACARHTTPHRLTA